jgi:hypothetical protein
VIENISYRYWPLDVADGPVNPLQPENVPENMAYFGEPDRFPNKFAGICPVNPLQP